MLLILKNLSSVSVPADTGCIAGAGPEAPGVPHRCPGSRTSGASRGKVRKRTGRGAGRLSPAGPAVNSPPEPCEPRSGARSRTGLARGRRAQPVLCCSAPLPQSRCQSHNWERKNAFLDQFIRWAAWDGGVGVFLFYKSGLSNDGELSMHGTRSMWVSDGTNQSFCNGTRFV